jgi:hypothetical protein
LLCPSDEVCIHGSWRCPPSPTPSFCCWMRQ